MTSAKRLHQDCKQHDHMQEAAHGCSCECGEQIRSSCCYAAQEQAVQAEPAVTAGGSVSRTYLLQGLGCAHCGAKIEQAVGQLPEVETALLTFATKKLQVTARGDSDLLAAVQQVCDSIEAGICVEAGGGLTDRRQNTAPADTAGWLSGRPASPNSDGRPP